MNPFFQQRLLPVLACALALSLGAGPVWAEKPEGVGQGKPAKAEKQDKKDKPEKAAKAEKADNKSDKATRSDKPVAKAPAVEVRIGSYFGDPQRTAARDYYGKQAKAGHCPPGLAKKNNGCMPPGQAKKWQVGQPLPRDVVVYTVPYPVVVQLGTPPAGYKYVRVASDILLIAIGTSMVIDAIEDLGRL